MPPPEVVPGPFEPGSNLLRDLRSAVVTANYRVEEGLTGSFGEALQEVLDDLVGKRDYGQTFSKKPLLDWNWKRGGGPLGRGAWN